MNHLFVIDLFQGEFAQRIRDLVQGFKRLNGKCKFTHIDIMLMMYIIHVFQDNKCLPVNAACVFGDLTCLAVEKTLILQASSTLSFGKTIVKLSLYIYKCRCICKHFCQSSNQCNKKRKLKHVYAQLAQQVERQMCSYYSRRCWFNSSHLWRHWGSLVSCLGKALRLTDLRDNSPKLLKSV